LKSVPCVVTKTRSSAATLVVPVELMSAPTPVVLAQPAAGSGLAHGAPEPHRQNGAGPDSTNSKASTWSQPSIGPLRTVR
jgi:hypothetical protein